ncbi:MAG: hypothetical protein HOM34_02105 [Planctomycetes bacterium]|jgi:phosphopantothenoylcysteine decarboxylase/phosphopantothenate--cysteine ligase|nr:hypothetical protein [Planctomycetota bacterium]MBT4029626.1 hypothetical protein [Planctomycetota bacterium]MBT4560179.1 hypothetical protein [Planctomycetota bacterium]MBT5100897.1 hypothetical protein [Planctomycetota bacterium]MBT5119496.1 hypothetical protein [Planctomycetota bacterium]
MSKILLGVTGSAACFKAVAIASALTKLGHEVQVVLTPAAARFVTPLQFSCVTGIRALDDEWAGADPAGMDHISLARWADALIIAPATADTIGWLAHGMAPGLLGSLALAFSTTGPRAVAPAMNPQMWSNPSVERNIEQLASDGWQIFGPAQGDTACGETGPGRFLEADEVVTLALSLL